MNIQNILESDEYSNILEIDEYSNIQESDEYSYVKESDEYSYVMVVMHIHAYISNIHMLKEKISVV